MDVAQLKYSIIEQLIQTNDENLLKKVAELMKSVPTQYSEGHPQSMSVEELQERIRKAESDIEEGRVYSTEEAKKKLGL